jgi:hypothetical protein
MGLGTTENGDMYKSAEDRYPLIPLLNFRIFASHKLSKKNHWPASSSACVAWHP